MVGALHRGCVRHPETGGVFANDRQAIGRRVYPAQADSLGVALFSDGGPATFRNVKAWEMTPSNPY